MAHQVVADTILTETAMDMARSMAVVDPLAMRRTKQRINESKDSAGLTRELKRSLEIDLELEGEGSDNKRAFLAALSESGQRGTLAWRD